MKDQSLGSSVGYVSQSPLRGDDLLDSVLEEIREVCKKHGVAIVSRNCGITEIFTTEPMIKLGELLFICEGRIGYTRTAYRRTTHPNPQITPIQQQEKG